MGKEAGERWGMSGSSEVVRRVARLFGDGTLSGWSDADLLWRFVSLRDRGAIEALVERHGRAVLGVCRRMLDDPSDVDDAYQATMLVLIERAGAVRRPERLGAWLHGVAVRVAGRVRARRRAGGRAMGEPEAPDRRGLEPDARHAVDEELGRLSERDRLPILLCDLDELSYAEAAERLGVSETTLRGRLARGRERLRRRLERRGVAPVVVGGGEWFGGLRVSSESVTGRLGMPDSAVRRLAIEEIRAMRWMRAIRVGTVLVGVSLGWAALRAASPRQDPGGRNGPPAAAAPAAVMPPQQVREPYVIGITDVLRVEVLEALPARPISGELLVRPDGRIALPFYGEIEVAGLTMPQAKGRVVEHLRKFLRDEILGLVEDELIDPKNPDAGIHRVDVAPEDSRVVFVEVSNYASKVYYVQGDVAAPGRMPWTGNDTVLDAIQRVGGLNPTARTDAIRLFRPARDGRVKQDLQIDFDEVLHGDDTLNVLLEPGDRLIVPRDAERAALVDNPTQPTLEKRISDLEEKLDRILDRLDAGKAGGKPVGSGAR
jgi:RNA polymerase sigma factor (sigma-70 family)